MPNIPARIAFYGYGRSTQQMATTKRLFDLFTALASGDVNRARELAASICGDEEKKGHSTAARRLRNALRPQDNGLVTPSGVAGSILPITALVRLSADVALEDVVLSSDARQTLQELVNEWTNRERLHKRGIPHRTKLLFYGPPGCGKSLTARALGRALALPAFVVRFDAVIGAYLGQTAVHLRQLFSYAETQPCILLLDELDALGKQRGNPLDVGELDRIVIALMQELEHSHPRGMIVGTSNLPKHLDDALWRRFDLALEFRAPTSRALAAYVSRLAKQMRIKLPPAARQRALKSKSFADAEELVVAEARRQVLRQPS